MAIQYDSKTPLTSTPGIWRDNEGSMRLDHDFDLKQVIPWQKEAKHATDLLWRFTIVIKSSYSTVWL